MDLVRTTRFSIRKATIDDAVAIEPCQHRAFERDQLVSRIYPPERKHLTSREETRDWHLKRLRKRIQQSGSSWFIITDRERPDAVLGYSCWFAPGHAAQNTPPYSSGKSHDQKDTSTEVLHETHSPSRTADDDQDELPACLDADMGKEAERLIAEAKQRVWGEDSNYWYLAVLGVDPDYQRRGLGKMLLQSMLERADKDGLPVYLESSPQGAPMYPRLGFETVGEIVITKDQCVLLAMTRQPQNRNPLPWKTN